MPQKDYSHVKCKKGYTPPPFYRLAVIGVHAKLFGSFVCFLSIPNASDFDLFQPLAQCTSLQINSKFKRKIESIVRKPRRNEDDEENRSPCPHCEFLLPDTELDCSSCKTTIDYCILTVRDMLNRFCKNTPNRREKFLDFDASWPIGKVKATEFGLICRV